MAFKNKGLNMKWRLTHQDVYAEDTREIKSRSTVLLEFIDATCAITDTVEAENHILGSKKVLMDAAYKLEDLARQMKKKAETLK